MQDVKIYLKSGQVVEFVTKNLTKETNQLTGQITKLTWQNIQGETMLFDIALDQVAAITIKEREF